VPNIVEIVQYTKTLQ